MANQPQPRTYVPKSRQHFFVNRQKTARLFGRDALMWKPPFFIKVVPVQRMEAMMQAGWRPTSIRFS